MAILNIPYFENYAHHHTVSIYATSSSAVAERPRDALCSSVVSFNGIIPRAHSSDLLLRTVKCCCVVFGVTLMLLVTHSVAVFRRQQTPPLPMATSVISSPSSVAADCVALAAPSVHSTRWSQILVQNRDFCLPQQHSTPLLKGSSSEYCHDVWYGKTRTVWLPDG